MVTSRSASGGGLRATALLFSGRPDPEWTLDAADAAALVSLLRSAPAPAEGAAPAPPALGYRGVRLVSEASGISWTVYSGVIAEERPGSPASLRGDPGRRVERAALVTAPKGALPASFLDGLVEDPPR